MSTRSATTAQHGLTIIAFIGSVFSPYYAWRGAGAGRSARTIARSTSRSTASGSERWAMTERGPRRPGARRDALSAVGPSALSWDGAWPRRSASTRSPFPFPASRPGHGPPRSNALTRPDRSCSMRRGVTAGGRLRPSARVQVALDQPRTCAGSGDGYFDMQQRRRAARKWLLVLDMVARRLRDGAAVLVRGAAARREPLDLALALTADGSLTLRAAAPRGTPWHALARSPRDPLR